MRTVAPGSTFKTDQEVVRTQTAPWRYNQRECPYCGACSLAGMPGSREAHCKNCGYKDPCCTDH